MKKILIKIPALFAMLITLFSFVFYVASFVNPEGEDWYAFSIFAMFSVLFYFVDMIISFVKAIRKDDVKFNLILAIVLLGSIPMALTFAGSGNDVYNVIWVVYAILMLALEVVSIKKAIDYMKANKKAK